VCRTRHADLERCWWEEEAELQKGSGAEEAAAAEAAAAHPAASQDAWSYFMGTECAGGRGDALMILSVLCALGFAERRQCELWPCWRCAAPFQPLSASPLPPPAWPHLAPPCPATIATTTAADEEAGVLVRSGAYEVDLACRQLKPCYWPASRHRVLRGTWFVEKGGEWVPLKVRHAWCVVVCRLACL
jgi:hypothetical protein